MEYYYGEIIIRLTHRASIFYKQELLILYIINLIYIIQGINLKSTVY